MQTISVEAARAQAQLLAKSSDRNVQQYAEALGSEAEAAAAAGNQSFDLAAPATAGYQAATDALAAALGQN